MTSRSRVRRDSKHASVRERARMKRVVAAINQDHNVEGLCWELPQRIEALRLQKGDRLAK